MKNLIVTAAGKSTRFEGLRPKWMLTHPMGNWMLVEALKNIDFNSIDKVYFGFMKEHIEQYDCIDGIKSRGSCCKGSKVWNGLGEM